MKLNISTRNFYKSLCFQYSELIRDLRLWVMIILSKVLENQAMSDRFYLGVSTDDVDIEG